MLMRNLILAITCFAISSVGLADEDPGHSKHGSAFDSGMRLRPWEMPGIGTAPFEITTKDPEVQKWFNQGNVLLHSFWFEEAERSFRWCLKLEPDNAMAYWGLARCGFTWFTRGQESFGDPRMARYRTFLDEAIKRKNKVSDRERMFIEAWEVGFAPTVQKREDVLIRKLEEIAVKYPDDIEARAFLAIFNIGHGSALATQGLVDQVLAKNPMHPGVHHASIHNWDGLSSEQALKSCALYGKAAPGIGHALHMPGHVYSKVGMWNEAAIAMDSATRTELRYMNDRLALPFETWNYSHNRNYLCYIQEQLGLAEASIQGARDMMAAPRDPDYNPTDFGMAAEGISALTRALIKFERWQEIITPGSIPNLGKTSFAEPSRLYAESIAYSKLGNPAKARICLAELQRLMKGMGPMGQDPNSKIILKTAEAFLFLAEGKSKEGREALIEAATAEQKLRTDHAFVDDPPFQPWPLQRLLGDLYLSSGDNYLALDAYQKGLANEPNDGFCLAGLAKTYAKLGDRTTANRYSRRLAYVWSGADPNLKWSAEVKALGLDQTPLAETPSTERRYQPQDLASFGPANWQPYSAPQLDAIAADGKHVRLEDYRGKNVLLVFFLGTSCVHCVQQLEAINKRAADFGSRNTVLLAVCSAPPEKNSPGDVHFTLLSDPKHDNARRFASYDDFEDMELHSTILIDAAGKVRWKRTGGDPFSNVDFLLGEITRVNGK
jgi:peroxiredoxin/tetratricopeptide (TPR) repeat protein